jgi:hypothetical protein
MKSASTNRVNASEATCVYHDILCFIGAPSDEIEQFMRRIAIEITNQP